MVDTDNGIIKNLTKGTEFKAQPFPDFIKEIMKYGGLINYVREKV